MRPLTPILPLVLLLPACRTAPPPPTSAPYDPFFVPILSLPEAKYSLGPAIITCHPDGSATLQYPSGNTWHFYQPDDNAKRSLADAAAHSEPEMLSMFREIDLLNALPAALAAEVTKERAANTPGDAVALARWLLTQPRITLRYFDPPHRQATSGNFPTTDRATLEHALND